MIFDNFKKEFIKAVKYSLPFLLMGVFLVLAFYNIDLSKAFGYIQKISWFWLFVYSGVFIFSHYIRAVRWKLMIKSIKSDTSLLTIFASVIIGYGVNCVVPRLGEVYKGLFLGKWEGLSRTSMFGSIIVERVIDIFFFSLAAVISVYIYSGDLFKELTWLSLSITIAFITVFVIIFILYLMVIKKNFINNRFFSFLSRFSPKSVNFIKENFDSLIEGFSSIKTTKDLLMVIFYSALIIVVYVLNTYTGFFLFNVPTGHFTFAMAWVLMTIGSIGVLIPTPGGTGSYHILTILVLTSLYNFNNEFSAAYAILTHFISYVLFIGMTLFLIILVNRINQKKGAPKEDFFSVFKSRMN